MVTSRVERRLKLKEKRYEVEQLIKTKFSEDYKVLEEVFDYPTLMSVYRLLKRGVISSMIGVVKAGKESRIYWGKGREDEDLAVKIYLVSSAEFRRGMLPYIEGDPRFDRLRHSRRALVYAWATKEFKNLKRALTAGVRVPKPLAVLRNVLVMEFVGEEGVPAPLLREVDLEDPGLVYRSLKVYLRRLYTRAQLVHGDFSEYNVMIQDGKPVLFDLSQSISLRHPRANELLRRDLDNLTSYFGDLGVEVDPVEVLEKWIRRG